MGLFGTSPSNSNASQAADQAKVAGKKSPQSPGKVAPRERILSDDDVTLSAQQPAAAPKVNLALRDYKVTVAQDIAFVRDTLRHKLVEYDVPLDTRMGISKSATGRVEIDADIAAGTRERIEQDLSQSQAFRGAFERLSVNQPTLDYVDNVTRLSQAYGTRNNVFDSLISRDGSFNGLQDIAHRYQSVRQTLPEASIPDDFGKRYQFSVNARA